MTVSFIGAQGAAAATVTIPAHVSGDLILIFAYRDGSNTMPTTPAAGGTVPTWNVIGSTGGNTNSSNFRWAVATGSTTTSGTWTNATELICLVYRGASIGASIGGSGSATTTVNYPALTLQRTNNTSWAVGVAGHRTATNVEVAPGAMVNRASSGTEAAGHDTNATVTTWASTNVTVNASSAYRSWVVELRDPSWTETPVVGAFTFTGNAADLRHKVQIEGGTGTFALNGQQAALLKDYRLTAETGTFSVTGQPATLLYSPSVEAATGSFALTGGAPALLLGRYLSGGSGTFIETGQPAAFRRTWAIRPAAGDFTFTGNPAAFTEIGAYEIDAIAGAFALTGNAVTLTKTAADELTPLVGTFTLASNGATLTRSRLFMADSGQFTLTGQAAFLLQGWRATGDCGQFLLTGNPAAFTAARSLLGATGTFTLTGNPAGLSDTDQLDAAAGIFTLTGNNVTLLKSSSSRRRVVLIF